MSDSSCPPVNKRLILATVLLAAFLLFLLCFGFLRNRSEKTGPAATTQTSDISVESPYGFGFRRGHDAFCEQFGIRVPPETSPRPTKVFSYMSDHASASDDGEMEKGYVDGYHRAAAMYSCPRGE